MTEPPPEPPPSSSPAGEEHPDLPRVKRPSAAQLRRRRFSFVWLIPLIAAGIAIYLGYRTLAQQGPLLTISFTSGEGLNAGQTQVKFKAVALGTVESIDLSNDNQRVIARVRMTRVGARFLTNHARFWVVRPHFSPNDISGLDTLVSGAYIAVDPGPPGGRYADYFTGLTEPPGVRSDEPGQTYQLTTQSIGSLSPGSPVFYRDIQVGEVLGYDFGDGLGPITVSVFVRDPFDKLIRPQSHFWKSSGVTAGLQGGGFHVEFQSLQAVISGGITFDVPHDEAAEAPSANNAVFALYNSAEEAEAAGYQTQIPLVAYFQTSVVGLTVGSPVNVLGIQVGTVTDVKLIVDPYVGGAKVRIAMALQPERVIDNGAFPPGLRVDQVLQTMVAHGLRAELDTLSYITGQKEITLAFVQNAPPAVIGHEGAAIVLPSQAGGLDNIIATTSVITTKLSKIPFEKIGDDLDRLLLTTNSTLGGPQLKQTLASLNGTLTAADGTLQVADKTLKGLSQSYGADSDFESQLEQVMSQANDTLRSVKALTDYLDRHPASLLFGRSGK